MLKLNGASIDADMTDSLTRAVIISLFTWRRAETNDDYDGSKYGWWGDTFSTDDDKIGSKLYQLYRRKLTNSVILEAKEMIENALQWLIDDGLASAIDVTVERDENRLNSVITITKGDDITSLDFEDILNGNN